MRTGPLRLALVCLAAAGIFHAAHADESKPTCTEEPLRRDCVKVEDPDAAPPKPSVHRRPKPQHPIARPMPSAGGHQAR